MKSNIVIIADAHLCHDEEEHPSYTLAKKYIKATKPELLILNGDAVDFSYLSSYNESLLQLREGKRLKLDMDMLQKELDFFQKYSKKVIYLQGNHERRLERRVQMNPNLSEGLLSIDKLLDLKQRDIKWILEVNQPYKIPDIDLFVMHGTRFSIHFAAGTLRDYMVNIIIAHTHRIQEFSMRGLQKEFTCYGAGCLSSKNPDYLNGKMSQWINGFVVVDVEGKDFTVQNIHIVNNSFVRNGRLWKLKE